MAAATSSSARRFLALPGQIVVGAGGTLTAQTAATLAGNPPPVLKGTLWIQSGGQVFGTIVVNGQVMNFGQHTLGDDPATIVVNGSYTLGPTGVIIAEVGPTSYSQLIVNGPLTLNGGTLEFLPVQGGMFQIGKTYDVLSVSGGVTGAFADVTVAQPDGMPFVMLSADFIDGSLEVTPMHMPGSFATAAVTANQHAVAGALDRASPTATGTLGDLIDTLSLDDMPTVRADFDPLSGEAYGGFASAALQANRDFAAMLRVRCCADQRARHGARRRQRAAAVARRGWRAGRPEPLDDRRRWNRPCRWNGRLARGLHQRRRDLRRDRRQPGAALGAGRRVWVSGERPGRRRARLRPTRHLAGRPRRRLFRRADLCRPCGRLRPRHGWPRPCAGPGGERHRAGPDRS